ncbi:phytoene/squalene synthase family protein [Enterovirga aerilata]|uniref:Phytoene/squalene synthase family protein n=1 Tax=Enterovirga aerilata TaxID=2730920 RepID=A0A849I6W4_9HYPH|nr:phytoene/squalene synthase family protein [Enterovirga sp. DB1703]NNM72149.1 phytoene/squalene synthase family protein [Enterovirga sp. DB1703]
MTAEAHCEALVREGDPDRYFATLFAPADKRPYLFALYAFSGEVARIRDAISGPMPGEIRLQWWRDALAGEARGSVADHPVAAALLAAIDRFRLPVQPFLDLVEARTFDLYDDPMPGTGDLEGYLGETSSALIRLASLILADGRDPGGAEAAGHAGLAYGVTGLLRALPWHSRRGQVFIPRDMLERHGVTRDDIVMGRGGPGFLAALADARALARRHMARFEELRGSVTAEIRPAFLPVALVPGYLARMEKPGYDPFGTVIDRPAWTRIARLWLASRG